MICYKKIINKLDDIVLSKDDIVFVDEDSGIVAFSNDEKGILRVDLRFKQHKAFKK